MATHLLLVAVMLFKSFWSCVEVCIEKSSAKWPREKLYLRSKLLFDTFSARSVLRCLLKRKDEVSKIFSKLNCCRCVWNACWSINNVTMLYSYCANLVLLLLPTHCHIKLYMLTRSNFTCWIWYWKGNVLVQYWRPTHAKGDRSENEIVTIQI